MTSRKRGFDFSDSLAVTVTEIITQIYREVASPRARIHQGWDISDDISGERAAPRSDYMSRYVLVTRTARSPLLLTSDTTHDHHEKRETGYRQLLSLIATSTNDVTCQSSPRANSDIYIYIYWSFVYIYIYIHLRLSLHVCMVHTYIIILIGKDVFENPPVDKIVFDWPIKMKRAKIFSWTLDQSKLFCSDKRIFECNPNYLL